MSSFSQTLAADVLLGIICGTVLAVLVCYAFFLALGSSGEANAAEFKKAIAFLTLLLVAKTLALLFFHGFRIDVGTYEAWALRLAASGPASMYRSGYFLDYPPGYLYPLWASGAVARALGAPNDVLRMIIGSPALIADFGLGLLIFALTLRFRTKAAAWLALFFFAFNPALLFDTVVWVQTDSAFTLALLLSIVMIIDDEFGVGSALAALALLIKPQAISLLPVLFIWTVRRGNWRDWVRAALAFVATVIVTVAPFQLGHPLRWLPDLYLSTGAYYHETSVNAFNFMALLGGLRAPDSETIVGCSYFTIGISLLFALYAAVLWLLGRNPVRRNLQFACFITSFGFFMFAPRIHERYAYPAVIFAIPLAVEDPVMLSVFAVLTVTFMSNLAVVLHVLNAGTFLQLRDPFSMAVSLLNLGVFVSVSYYWYSHRDMTDNVASSAFGKWFTAPSMSRGAPQCTDWLLARELTTLPWSRTDSISLVFLTVSGGILRFWHLGHPAEIVFDEVHFVGQARHYLHSEPFLDPHPPLAKLLIAAGILLFGDHPSSWRIANALMGTVMVLVTYLLGRRIFASRLAASIAASLVAFDGFFIVDSRIGCIDIVYLCLNAIAYLLLFRFFASNDLYVRRRLVLVIGMVLGLCLGSKLYIPAATFLLVSSFLLLSMWHSGRASVAADNSDRTFSKQHYIWQMTGAALILGSVSMVFYLVTFLPHYLLGWWGGIEDLLYYYKDVIWYEKSVASATHPYASPWWSWPLMLRPVAYWQDFPLHGRVQLIWGAGNPLTWWAVVPAIIIVGMRAIQRPTLSRIFLITGFFTFYLIWIPIGRILFLYHYLPSLYIGYLALGSLLADLWEGKAQSREGFILLLSIVPVLTLGFIHILTEYQLITYPVPVVVSALLVIAVFGAHALLSRNVLYADRLVMVTFLLLATALFFYYLPLWLGTPITREGYYARMWFEGPALPNWI
jgi:dolichyl-phosphate-mannose--protein O-mannosyl transferase/Gpi18-like mannosyltransferase